MVRGLGGATRNTEDRWTVPTGIGGRHISHKAQRYFAIDGDVIDPTSCQNHASDNSRAPPPPKSARS